MPHVLGHHRPRARPRRAPWMLAPIGVSVSLSMLGVWIVPDFVLMEAEVLPPGAIVTTTSVLPGRPADGSVSVVPSAESVHFNDGDVAAEPAPTF